MFFLDLFSFSLVQSCLSFLDWLLTEAWCIVVLSKAFAGPDCRSASGGPIFRIGTSLSWRGNLDLIGESDIATPEDTQQGYTQMLE
jgi:hypothetical protein